MLQRNEFLDWLASDPNWGASDNKKRPLYFGDFLQTNNPDDISFATKDKLDKLPTLNQLDEHPSLNSVNRAYRLHASDNLVISIDVEPASHQSYLDYYAKLPAHYAEYSRNNGIHLYYRLKRGKLSPSVLNMILTSSVYKYPNKIDTLETPLPFVYEVLMNQHWVTFTEKTILDNNLKLEEDAPDEIYQMLEHIASIQQKKLDLSGASVSISAIEPSETALKLADLVRENKKAIKTISELDVSDYNNDDSSYEFACAIRLSYLLLNRLSNPKPFDASYLDCDINDIHYDDKIQAIIELIQDIIPERNKHMGHIINGIPYLLHFVQKAFYAAEQSHKPNQN